MYFVAVILILYHSNTKNCYYILLGCRDINPNCGSVLIPVVGCDNGDVIKDCQKSCNKCPKTTIQRKYGYTVIYALFISSQQSFSSYRSNSVSDEKRKMRLYKINFFAIKFFFFAKFVGNKFCKIVVVNDGKGMKGFIQQLWFYQTFSHSIKHRCALYLY